MKALLLFLLTAFSSLAVTPSNVDFPLGPIGGTFRIATGDTYARVTAVTAGMPGEAAGLEVGDFITGTDGVVFTASGDRFQGVARQLGWAIEQAEATDGILSLDLIRAGSGLITVPVTIGTSGSLSPAFPLNSPKWQTQADESLDALNDRLINNNSIGYPTGWAGLSLLASPNWNDTTGAKPYRLGIDKVYTYYKDIIERAEYTSYEQRLFDGTDNPHFTGNYALYLENWYIGLGTMFLAEYYEKTQDPADLALLQMAAEKIANRIQWWHQPNTRTDLTYTTLRPGIVGHGGVSGDYMHYSFGGGINIVGVHLSGGLAMAKRAGVDMSVAPMDGRYWGYNSLLFDDDPTNDPVGEFLPAGLTVSDNGTKVLIGGVVKNLLPNSTTHPELGGFIDDLANRQPTLDEKLEIIWSYYKRSQNTNSGYIVYAPGTAGLSDSFGRTLGTLHTANQMQVTGRAFNDVPAGISQQQDETRLNLLKSYTNTQYNRSLDIHATNMQGPAFYFMSSASLGTRERQHFLDNHRFFYNLMRENDATPAFMRGRLYGGGSGNNQDLANIYFALAQGVASGGLTITEGYDTVDKRLVDFSKVPHLEWINLEKRTISTTQTSIDFDLEVTDGSGSPTTDYTASWSGPATVNFSSDNTLDTTVSSTIAGAFDLMLTVQSGDGSIVTEEPIRVSLLPDCGPNYDGGVAKYDVYTNITGSAVSDLTSNAKFPDSPDSSSFLNSLKGTQGGNNFGATLTTLIVAPETGTYRFYLVTDDQGSLLFNSSGEGAAGAVEIASVPGWAASGQWDKYASQQSIEITLTAGEKYYLQGLMKEGAGGEPFEIGWTSPSNSTIEIISSAYLAYPKDVTPAAITTQPVDISTTIGETITFTAEVTGPEPRLFQWQLNGENYGNPQTVPTLEIPNSSVYLGGQWQLVYTSGDTVLTSDSVTLTFTDAGQLVTGCLWQEIYNGLPGGQISQLLNAEKFPFAPDSSGPITETYTNSMGNNYGQRWSGWIIPTETARYRFIATGDNTTRLLLSPTEYICHAETIINNTTWVSNRDFDSTRGTPSEYIELEAGNRYAVQFLHKDTGGANHAAFTWQKEGDPIPADGSEGIPAANLQYRTGGPDLDEICPPLAIDDSFITVAGETITLDALVNDRDNDLGTLVIMSVSNPYGTGTATVSADGKTIRFSTVPTDSGIITLTYMIEDSDGMFAPGSISIDIRNLSTGLALHYPFEETDLTGGVADATSNSANGTLTNTPEPCPGGIVGAALEFGGGDRINVDPTVLDTIDNEITVSYWIRPTEFTGQGVRTLFAGDSGGDRILNFHYPWFTQAIIDSGSGGGPYDRLLRFSGIDRAGLLNRWTHIVFTKDAVSGQVIYYVDGEVWVQGNNQNQPIGTATTFQIGDVQSYRGKIDEFRIYNRVISPQEVTALFEEPASATVTLTAAPDFVMENSGGKVTYTLTRTGGTGAEDLPVQLQITGQAENGIDYQTLETTVSIPGGFSQVTFDMLPIDDQLGENTESVNIRILADPLYLIEGEEPLVSIGNDDVLRTDIFELDPAAGKLRFRFSPNAQLSTDPELQYSNTLMLNSWAPMMGTPADIGNEIKELDVPAPMLAPDTLFFRWKLE